MRVQKFRGDSVDKLLRRIKQKLGTDVQLMGSRSVRQPGLLGWFRPRQVEITVAIPERHGSDRRMTAGAEDKPQDKDDAKDKGGAGSGEAVGSSGSPDNSDAACHPEGEVESILMSRGVPRKWAHLLGRRVRGGSNGHLIRDVWPRNAAIHPPEGEDPRIVALVGPTGAGKTTTCAKLAAEASLGKQKRVGLVTLDTFRIGAVEQLRSYARILRVPLEVVFDPGELSGAFKRLSDCHLVFVDTAGRSHRDDDRIQDLKQFLGPQNVHETHLVLSVDTEKKQAAAIFGAYRDVGYNRLLLTKIDESESPGKALALAQQSGVPLSYIATGQDVPGDIGTAPEVLDNFLLRGVI